MILVTVGGVVEFKFERIFKIVDELCDEGILEGNEIIAQCGFNDYVPRNYKAFDFLSAEEFKKLVSKSEFAISHAGTGTVVSAVNEGKKVIIFPRLAKYNEHLDDHQLELCELFEKSKYALVAHNKKELIACIQKIPDFTPAKFVSNNQRIVDLIISCMENRG